MVETEYICGEMAGAGRVCDSNEMPCIWGGEALAVERV